MPKRAGGKEGGREEARKRGAQQRARASARARVDQDPALSLSLSLPMRLDDLASRKPRTVSRGPYRAATRRNRADNTGSEVLLLCYINIGVPTPRRCRCVRYERGDARREWICALSLPRAAGALGGISRPETMSQCEWRLRPPRRKTIPYARHALTSSSMLHGSPPARQRRSRNIVVVPSSHSRDSCPGKPRPYTNGQTLRVCRRPINQPRVPCPVSRVPLPSRPPPSPRPSVSLLVLCLCVSWALPRLDRRHPTKNRIRPDAIERWLCN